jgi:hypothetical protein
MAEQMLPSRGSRRAVANRRSASSCGPQRLYHVVRSGLFGARMLELQADPSESIGWLVDSGKTCFIEV